jgi:hypothetical protein
LLVITAEGGEAVVGWSALFPQARLQRATAIGEPWADVPSEGLMQSDWFVTRVPAGIFRLR